MKQTDSSTPPTESVPTHSERADVTKPSWRRLRPLIVVVIVALLLPVITIFGLLEPIKVAADWLREQGWSLIPLYVVVAGLLIAFAVLPSHGVNLLTGYVYGFAVGVVMVMLIIGVGSAVGHIVGRRLPADHLRQMVERKPTGKALLAAMVDARGWRATFAVFLTRLAPQFPFALGNVLAASLGVRLVPFFVGSALGMLPRAAIVVWLGERLEVWDPKTTSPMAIIWAVIFAVVAMIALMIWSYRIVHRLHLAVIEDGADDPLTRKSVG